MRVNPCRYCALSVNLNVKHCSRYSSEECAKCENIQKHREYLLSQRKFAEGEQITSIEELLKQEWVMWYHSRKVYKLDAEKIEVNMTPIRKKILYTVDGYGDGLITDVTMEITSSKFTTTNADRIRNMSDEELLDFICSIETYEEGSVMTIENGVSMHTVTEVKEWLQSEAE